MPRLILMLVNSIAFGFLIYHLVRIIQVVPTGTKKTLTLAAGIILILLPVVMLVGFVKPTAVYMLVYPIGIGAFIYMVRIQD